MKKIFLVDDLHANLAIGKEALNNLYKTYPLASSKAMFQLFANIVPDLILLDIQMPEMDGYETIKILKNHDIYTNIPVIFVSALVDEESINKCFELGAADYVQKPYDRTLLINKIEKHI